ncbi:putative Ubiquitin carboxyl-terminal hydrolase [Blattamonas nauphoetae]|uniref:ubiquitinyl hydrolase 1 n=1 Tax=Blattamonas nauphoetae TaxID=2049346 RepID=A0ABQ9XWF8_9EUKA|nr:putative Ubiquitin carboxyl-terminal hydrolase [Blattamonas nauphoetae]
MLAHPRHIAVNPSLLFNTISNISANTFRLGIMADAEELLTFLLQKVDEELRCILLPEANNAFISHFQDSLGAISTELRSRDPRLTSSEIIWGVNPRTEVVEDTLFGNNSLLTLAERTLNPSAFPECVRQSISRAASGKGVFMTEIGKRVVKPHPYTLRANSELLNPVQQCFNGIVSTDYRCLKCDHVIQRPEITRIINLQFKDSRSTENSPTGGLFSFMSTSEPAKPTPLDTLLENIFVEGERKFECENCDHNRASTKTFISLLPRVLVLSVNRFRFDPSGLTHKIHTPVVFPPKLTLTKYTRTEGESKTLIPLKFPSFRKQARLLSPDAWNAGLRPRHDEGSAKCMLQLVRQFTDGTVSDFERREGGDGEEDTDRSTLSLGELFALTQLFGFDGQTKGVTTPSTAHIAKPLFPPNSKPVVVRHPGNMDKMNETESNTDETKSLLDQVTPCPSPPPLALSPTLPLEEQAHLVTTHIIKHYLSHREKFKKGVSTITEDEDDEVFLMLTTHPLFQNKEVDFPSQLTREMVYARLGYVLTRPTLNETPNRQTMSGVSGLKSNTTERNDLHRSGSTQTNTTLQRNGGVLSDASNSSLLPDVKKEDLQPKMDMSLSRYPQLDFETSTPPTLLTQSYRRLPSGSVRLNTNRQPNKEVRRDLQPPQQKRRVLPDQQLSEDSVVGNPPIIKQKRDKPTPSEDDDQSNQIEEYVDDVPIHPDTISGHSYLHGGSDPSDSPSIPPTSASLTHPTHSSPTSPPPEKPKPAIHRRFVAAKEERAYGTVGSRHDYHLRGVVVHQGESVSSGHYMAYVKNLASSEWQEFNDRYVTARSENSVLNDVNIQKNCYLLFYVHQDSL